MNFSEFANRLKKIISGDENVSGGAFAKELFANILDTKDEYDLDNKVAPSTFRAYYRGDRDIKRFAPQIRKYVEPMLFEDYIDSLGDDVQRDIFKEFAKDCSGMTDQNIPEKVAELFKQIIVNACPVTKKVPKKSKASAVDKPVIEEDFALLNECGNKCPLCKAKLTETKKGVPVKKFVRVDILPLNLDSSEKAEFEDLEPAPDNLSSLDNQALLCRKCADTYVINTTPQEYAELMQKKRALVYLAELDAEAYDINVERGINQILDALSDLTEVPKKEDRATWNAFRVDRKIPEQGILQDTVTEFVLKYYRYIEKQYKQREREGKLRFRKVKNEISQCFELYDEAELSKKMVFDKLVFWLKEKTGCDDDRACIAMVSFFVQNCEVFRDEASE